MLHAGMGAECCPITRPRVGHNADCQAFHRRRYARTSTSMVPVKTTEMCILPLFCVAIARTWRLCQFGFVELISVRMALCADRGRSIAVNGSQTPEHGHVTVGAAEWKRRTTVLARALQCMYRTEQFAPVPTAYTTTNTLCFYFNQWKCPCIP